MACEELVSRDPRSSFSRGGFGRFSRSNQPGLAHKSEKYYLKISKNLRVLYAIPNTRFD